MGRSFMVIAGEASGDAIAAELILALRAALSDRSEGAPVFFGVGGEKVKAAGAELIFDLAENAVFGLEAFTRILEFRRRFLQLLDVAIKRRPDVIVCVDFSGFNSHFARAVRKHVAKGSVPQWNPKIVQYVSPQVWASRPWRARKLKKVVDLLLAIFPFEKAWYADRVAGMPVDFVGHPVVDRYHAQAAMASKRDYDVNDAPNLLVLAGSRPSELKRHLPILSGAIALIRKVKPQAQVTMVMADHLISQARSIGLPDAVTVKSAGLAEALAAADVAIAKSGTITLECAYFGVPTVAMYRTSWATYELARRIVTVPWIAMPNILANEEIFPEFVQERASSENIARSCLELLDDPARRNYVKTKLRQIAASLGDPGVNKRAAEAILELMGRPAPAAA
jgi:lipid-A-disaccharide synthase